MSTTNSTDENWILFQSRYDWIALPAELGVEVMKHLRTMNKGSAGWSVSNESASIALMTGDQMRVAQVKAKLVPPEDKEA